MPYAIERSTRLSSRIRMFISSMGIGDPAAMPVLLPHQPLPSPTKELTHLKELVSHFLSPLSISVSTPIKCVGTPCSAVHLSLSTVSRIARGLNSSEG